MVLFITTSSEILFSPLFYATHESKSCQMRIGNSNRKRTFFFNTESLHSPLKNFKNTFFFSERATFSFCVYRASHEYRAKGTNARVKKHKRFQAFDNFDTFLVSTSSVFFKSGTKFNRNIDLETFFIGNVFGYRAES